MERAVDDHDRVGGHDWEAVPTNDPSGCLAVAGMKDARDIALCVVGRR